VAERALPLHLSPSSPSWPEAASEVDPAPAELWARGRLELLAVPRRVAIVGTRSPTPYGEAQTERFARGLAAAGAVVVSGLARGVDATAHAAALDGGAGTIAVLGSGVDRPWPDGPLAERVARDGLLLSEFPPGRGPRRHHFPLRNRLIAALAQGVLVVEAAYGSGSLITARWGLELGRAIFAVPGRVDQPMARGCHRLLREGAQLVESPVELAAELGWSGVARERDEVPAHPLLAALVGETLSADELAERTGAPPPEVLAGLVELELERRVRRVPGGLWRLDRTGGRTPRDP